jgi:crotonobetainyl-CoA:carnitine CoA-transferase CaiB-like acyl-CoA transferase
MLPLDGVKVLDFSRLYPGPLCTMILKDMGADVIKVEDPKQGDNMRFTPPLGIYFIMIKST